MILNCFRKFTTYLPHVVFFSNDNLVKDIYLRRNMDDQGWVPINLISNFKKVWFGGIWMPVSQNGPKCNECWIPTIYFG